MMENMFDIEYHNIVDYIMDCGDDRLNNRTNEHVRYSFGEMCKYDISEHFPLITTKKVHWESVVHELLWFLKGSTNVKYLQDNNVKIWNEWADEYGELGPVYGHQWRNWTGLDAEGNIVVVDQIKNAIEEIKTNPSNRRIIVSAWNVAQISDMNLPPCHAFFQLSVNEKLGTLDCMLTQRSCDLFLGVPFNIASYSLLIYIIAKMTDLKPGTFTHAMGDAHLYHNHFTAWQEQSCRINKSYEPPKLVVKVKRDRIEDYTIEDFELINYKHHDAIKAKVAI